MIAAKATPSYATTARTASCSGTSCRCAGARESQVTTHFVSIINDVTERITYEQQLNTTRRTTC